jgi:hypothetical protein
MDVRPGFPAVSSAECAATPHALRGASEIRIDITQIGDGTAKGLKVLILGTRTSHINRQICLLQSHGAPAAESLGSSLIGPLRPIDGTE